jgi:hypothetical protein
MDHVGAGLKPAPTFFFASFAFFAGKYPLPSRPSCARGAPNPYSS